jgi:hypothetical protein
MEYRKIVQDFGGSTRRPLYSSETLIGALKAGKTNLTQRRKDAERGKTFDWVKP